MAPCKDAPVYLEQNSNSPGNTGLKQRHKSFCFFPRRVYTSKIVVVNLYACMRAHEMSQNMNVTWPEHHVVNSPVIPNIESVEALCEALHVVGADFLQKVNIVF